jgi:flagellar hook assembly protein FlgD
MSEVTRLNGSDIVGRHMTIRVEKVEGKKDHCVMFSSRLQKKKKLESM